MSGRNPRIPYFDAANAERLLQFHYTQISKLRSLIDKEPSNLLQLRLHMMAGDYLAIAQYEYALGYNLSQVREALTESAEIFTRVYELRGTELQFPAYGLEVDFDKSPDDPTAMGELRPLHPEDAIDYSLTNSEDNYNVVCHALIAREFDLAERLAGFIWDPPNATYIGPRSFCTPNGQRLAYGLRRYYDGDLEGAVEQWRNIRVNKASIHYRYQAAMLRALVATNPDQFLDALLQLLDWHARAAKRKSNHSDSMYYLCTPGSGLSVLAVQRGLINAEDLPAEDVYLPLSLLFPDSIP